MYLESIYDKVAYVFQNEKDVFKSFYYFRLSLPNIGARKILQILGNYLFLIFSCKHGFPTVWYFPKDDKIGYEYNSDRKLNDFITYINEKTGTMRDKAGYYLPTVFN